MEAYTNKDLVPKAFKHLQLNNKKAAQLKHEQDMWIDMSPKTAKKHVKRSNISH